LAYPIEDSGKLLELDCHAQIQEKKVSVLGDQVLGLEEIVTNLEKQIDLFEVKAASDEVTITTLLQENTHLQTELDVCKVNGCGPAGGKKWWQPLVYTLIGLTLGGAAGITTGVVAF
jgi:hypothetical protein